MELLTLSCPHCGAALQVENDLDIMYCKYCGTRIVVSGIDGEILDAKVRLKELEHEERLEEKRQEQERYKLVHETKKDRATVFYLMLPLLFILLIAAATYVPHYFRVAELKRVENEIIADINEGRYDEALVLTNKLYLDDGYSQRERKDWEQKRKDYVKLINQKQKDARKAEQIESGDGSGFWDWWPFG